MPGTGAGNPERVYVLGGAGREFVENEMGVRVAWQIARPGKGVSLGFSQLMHNLTLTRFLVAADRWAQTRSDFKLSEVRICYELASEAGSGDAGARGKEKIAVVPDGWVMFERVKEGASPERFPVLLEIDRGTMYRQRFKRHVAERIEFVRSGAYERLFGTQAVVIAYASTGAMGELSEGRRKTLSAWAWELLKEQGLEDWRQVFRFCAVAFGELYESPLFDRAVWYMPGEERPVRLFGE